MQCGVLCYRERGHLKLQHVIGQRQRARLTRRERIPTVDVILFRIMRLKYFIFRCQHIALFRRLLD